MCGVEEIQAVFCGDSHGIAIAICNCFGLRFWSLCVNTLYSVGNNFFVVFKTGLPFGPVLSPWFNGTVACRIGRVVLASSSTSVH